MAAISRRMPRIPISRASSEHGLAGDARAQLGARRRMATCLWLQPLAVREKISATAPAQLGPACLAGCASVVAAELARPAHSSRSRGMLAPKARSRRPPYRGLRALRLQSYRFFLLSVLRFRLPDPSLELLFSCVVFLGGGDVPLPALPLGRLSASGPAHSRYAP